MNESGSIVEFFYNLVPGSLFLILLKYFGIFDINTFFLPTDGYRRSPDTTLIVFGYIILGLFLGFVFQGMTKFEREKWGSNEDIAKRVKEKNPDEFRSVYIKINNVKNIDYKDPKIYTPTFYLMDNYLRGDKATFLPTHFSSRFAFWANIFYGFLVIALFGGIRLFMQPCLSAEKVALYMIVVIFIFVSRNLADKYHFGFYDTILKSYYMKTKKDSNRGAK